MHPNATRFGIFRAFNASRSDHFQRIDSQNFGDPDTGLFVEHRTASSISADRRARHTERFRSRVIGLQVEPRFRGVEPFNRGSHKKPLRNQFNQPGVKVSRTLDQLQRSRNSYVRGDLTSTRKINYDPAVASVTGSQPRQCWICYPAAGAMLLRNHRSRG